MQVIRDGTGQGYSAKVNKHNQLNIFSVQIPIYSYLNHYGKVFHILTEATPTGAGDCFLYVKNTSQTEELCINRFNFFVSGAETIELRSVSGTPVGGTPYTPVNMNTGFMNDAQCTCQYGNDITGLTSLNVISRYPFGALLTTPMVISLDYHITFPTGAAFGLYAVSGSVALKTTLTVDFRDCTEFYSVD